jgi:hypothetical protein
MAEDNAHFGNNSQAFFRRVTGRAIGAWQSEHLKKYRGHPVCAPACSCVILSEAEATVFVAKEKREFVKSFCGEDFRSDTSTRDLVFDFGRRGDRRAG